MRVLTASLWFVLGLLAGGLACGPALTARSRPAPPPSPAAAADSPLGLPRSLRTGRGSGPLLIDRTDLRIGTTVQFARVPTAPELDDLRFVRGLAHVVLTLDQWPSEFAPLTSLNRLPPEADLIVVLAGYPPSRAAAEAWNLLDTRARIIVLGAGTPPSGVIFDLNEMRGLERVIVDTDDPDRAGFERLQRPISFRVLKE